MQFAQAVCKPAAGAPCGKAICLLGANSAQNRRQAAASRVFNAVLHVTMLHFTKGTCIDGSKLAQ
jgi:hypothetical protein